METIGNYTPTQRPQSSSFLGLYRTQNINPQKELLWGLFLSIQLFTHRQSPELVKAVCQAVRLGLGFRV